MELLGGCSVSLYRGRNQLQCRLRKIGEEQNPASALMDLLKECRCVEHGRLIHAHISGSEVHRHDKLLLNMIIEMYGNCGSVTEACRVFECMTVKNVHSWTIMLVALAVNREFKRASRLFRDMLMVGIKPNTFTLTSILTTCSQAGDVAEGRKIDEMIAGTTLRSDTAVSNALISMYGKCGWLEYARAVFDSMPCKNNISWTAMVDAYCRRGEWAKALECFHDMEMEGVGACEMSLLAVLEAVRGAKMLKQGERIHARIVDRGWQRDPFLCTALVAMYSRCGSIHRARAVFQGMNKVDVESWNSIMSATGGLEALELFSVMQQRGVKPTDMSLVTALEACGSVCAAAWAHRLEESIVCEVFAGDVVVCSALMDAYAKCGRVADARRVFETYACMGVCTCIDVIAWSTIIAAYAANGDSVSAVELFYTMELQGITPNAVTLLSVLFACSHAGWVENGCSLLASMRRDRGLCPWSQHYTCVADMLGRAGWLLDAPCLAALTSYPNPSDLVPLTSLLGAYALHRGLK